MSKLYVMGNFYSDNSDNAQEIFNILENAGYVLGYNVTNKNACTIMKYEDIEEEEQA